MANDNEVNVKFGATTEGLKSGTKDAQDTVNESTGSMAQAFSSMSASIGESMAEMSAHVKEGAVSANEQLESISSSIKKVNETFALIAEVAVLGEVGKKLFETATYGAEYAEKINLAAQKTGIAGDSLERLQYAASTANVGFDQLQGGLEKFNKATVNAREGNVQLQSAFQAVGVSISDLQNLSPEELMDRVADSFSKTKDNGDKTALAIQLFGRAGAELIPVLDKGSSGLAELGDQAASVGGIMGQDAREKAQEFAEQLKLANEAGHGLGLQLSAQLAPTMQTITQAFIDSTKEGGVMRDVMSGISSVVDFLTRLFANMGAVVKAVARGIGALGASIDALGEKDTANKLQVIWKQFGQDIDEDQAKLDKFFQDLDNPPEMKKPQEEGGEKGSLHAPGAGGNKEKSQMAAFENQLALQKMNNDKMEDQDDQFHEYSKQQEADYWNNILQNQNLSEADRLSVQKKYYALAVDVDKSKLETYVATLKAEESAYGVTSQQKIELAGQARDAVVKAYGEESKEGQAALKEYQTAFKAAMAEKVKLADVASKSQFSSETNQLNLEEQLYKLDEAKNSSSLDEKITNESEFAQRKYQIKMNELQMELQAAQGNAVQMAQIQAQMQNTTEQYQNQMAIFAKQKSMEWTLNWDTALSGISNSFSTTINSILNGTKSISQSFASMALNIVSSMADMFVKMGAGWVMDEAKALLGFSEKTAASTSAASAQITNTQAVATANSVAAETSILSWASVAGAAGIASFAAAPWPIDIGAPAFGASMFAEAAAFSAAGGFDIPAGINPVTQLHAQEMVLPAKYANAIRDMTNTGGSSISGGGDIHLHVNAMDAKSVQDYFKTNSHTLAPALRRMQRNLTPTKV